MTEVHIVIEEKELDCIIEWFRIEAIHQSIGPIDIDAVLNILLMKTCMRNAIPFTVKVQSVGGD